MRAVVVAGLLLAGGVAGATRLSLGPYVQDVRADGFLVAYETDLPTDGKVVADGQTVITRGTHHEARLIGLKPGTRYRYRVLIDGEERAAAELGTAPDAARPFTFVVYGDTRNGNQLETEVAADVLAEAPELALHTGDLVPTGDDDQSWPLFFAHEAALLKSVPVYLVVGNHELYRDPNGEHVRRYFAPPDGGRERRYYSFRWGAAVRMVVMDGNGQFDEQTAWLTETLEAAQREHARHVFVFVHQPPLSTGGHCGAAVLQKDWVALFEHYQVRAVFAGHDHCYERLERNGIRYFVTGGGGAAVYEERQSCAPYDVDARRVYSAEHHYLRVRVSGDDVEVAAVRIERGQPPIEVVHLRAGEGPPVVLLQPPPLVDDRLVKSSLGGHIIDTVGGRWPLAAGGLVLVVFLGRQLRRRRLR